MKTNHPTPDNIEFKEITPDNWRIINSLSVKKEQKNFAAQMLQSLQEPLFIENKMQKFLPSIIRINP